MQKRETQFMDIIKQLKKYQGGVKDDWDFRISDLVKNPDRTDI